jgi:malate permease and related proteins
MTNINYEFLLFILIILFGYFSKRINIVQEKDGETLSRVLFNITLPALIVFTFSSIRIETSLLLIPIITICFGLLMFFISLFIFKKEVRKTKGMLSMLLPGFNVGLFAYPLIQTLFGIKGLEYIAMFDMGNAILIFGLCYLIAGYYATEEAVLDLRTACRKLFKSVPLMSYMVTLTINLSGLHFPTLVIDMAGIISKANSPLSLLLLGIYLSFSFERSHPNNMLKILLSRYITGLCIGFPLYFILPFDTLFRSVILLGLILPIGAGVIPYAVEFDYDKKFVGTVANATIIVSFVLVFLISNFQIHP